MRGRCSWRPWRTRILSFAQYDSYPTTQLATAAINMVAAARGPNQPSTI